MSLNHGDTTKQFHVNLKVVYCVHTVGVRVPWVQSLPWRWGLACPGPRVWYWAAPWRPPACQTTALQASRGKEEVSSSSQRTSEGHCKPAAYSQPWRSTIITSHSNTLCIHKIVWNSWKNVTTISWSSLFSNWTEFTQIVLIAMQYNVIFITTEILKIILLLLRNCDHHVVNCNQL